MKAFAKLAGLEARLALRSGDMLFFGIVMPVAIMLLSGALMPRESLGAVFSGVASIGICASGLMGIPLTLSGYRHAGILKRFRATPASPGLLLGAVAAAQAAFAVASCLVTYAAARIAFGMPFPASPPRFILAFAFATLAVHAMGYLIASVAPNAKVAGILCSLAYFPSIFLSGTTVPRAVMPDWLKAISGVLPPTQGVRLLEGAMLGLDPSLDLYPAIALATVAALSSAVSLAAFRWD